jgi:hypothetical protein
VRMEPFLHVGLVLGFGGLIFEYVGDFADHIVIGGGDWSVRVWRSTWDAKGVLV